jgi:MFS family permease
MAGVLVDIAPLRRYPMFRRLSLGNALSNTGSQLTVVAVAYEVYHLTHSALDVGLVSLVQLLPALFGAFVGGSIADAMDRRKLLVTTGTTMAAIAVAMALDVGRDHPSLALLYVLAGTQAFVQAINSPAQTAALLGVVEREMIARANALRQLSNQISSVIGPAVAGVLIASFGTTDSFWVIAGCNLVALSVLVGIGARPPTGGATRFGWRSIVEGFAFLKTRPVIQGCFIADLNAMVLGMPTALFPALAVTHFHGGARTVGLLYAAPGIGAIFGAALSGWTHQVRRPAVAITFFTCGWGLALVAFGLVPWLGPAVFFLGVAGAVDMVASVFRGTITQTETPDRLRGRLTSIQMAVVGNGPRLGNTEAGLVAAASSAQISVISGGIGCVVGMILIARLLPRFYRYQLPRADSDTEAPA